MTASMRRGNWPPTEGGGVNVVVLVGRDPVGGVLSVLVADFVSGIGGRVFAVSLFVDCLPGDVSLATGIGGRLVAGTSEGPDSVDTLPVPETGSRTPPRFTFISAN